MKNMWDFVGVRKSDKDDATDLAFYFADIDLYYCGFKK